jgi:hypothetical protein
MKTNTTNHLTSETPEIILGWDSMPTYGEVLPYFIGAPHLEIDAPHAGDSRENNVLLTSFWDTFRNTMALAA